MSSNVTETLKNEIHKAIDLKARKVLIYTNDSFLNPIIVEFDRDFVSIILHDEFLSNKLTEEIVNKVKDKFDIKNPRILDDEDYIHNTLVFEFADNEKLPELLEYIAKEIYEFGIDDYDEIYINVEK